jgi:hypothetical protein
MQNKEGKVKIDLQSCTCYEWFYIHSNKKEKRFV